MNSGTPTNTHASSLTPEQRVARAKHAAAVRASVDGMIARIAQRPLTDAQRQRLAELAGSAEAAEAS